MRKCPHSLVVGLIRLQSYSSLIPTRSPKRASTQQKARPHVRPYNDGLWTIPSTNNRWQPQGLQPWSRSLDYNVVMTFRFNNNNNNKRLDCLWVDAVESFVTCSVLLLMSKFLILASSPTMHNRLVPFWTSFIVPLYLQSYTNAFIFRQELWQLRFIHWCERCQVVFVKQCLSFFFLSLTLRFRRWNSPASFKRREHTHISTCRVRLSPVFKPEQDAVWHTDTMSMSWAGIAWCRLNRNQP